ncbi:MAG: diguanylate cyclase [Candidatus Omnitrophota bacterium]|jgi:diguanylate cyclase (GGDEF)-like protein
MIKNLNNLSLASRGIKYKLRISFYLMSVLPLLVSIYLISSYVLPKFGLKIDIALAIVISIIIALIGFFLIKEVIDRILSVTTEAKLIAAGDLSRKVTVRENDEVTDLSDALNQLTTRIRSNMDELKGYGEKTSEINLEIQRRVLVLSSLLQISSLISQGTKLEDILKVTVEKSRMLANSEVAFLLYREETDNNFRMKLVDGINPKPLLNLHVFLNDEVFSGVIKHSNPLLVDKQSKLAEVTRSALFEKFRVRNILALPVYLRGSVRAIFAVGNSKEDFIYRKEDVELLDVFSKQIAIAIENDLLMTKVEKLEIRDALTGLYNLSYIKSRLNEEIKRAIAYQRPCAFVVFDIDNFRKYHDAFGSLNCEATLKKIAALINSSVSEVDRVGRTADDEFAVILPERNKRQANEIAENIRKKIEFTFSEEDEVIKRLTVSGGISENPLDGVSSEELIVAACESLKISKEQGKNRIAVFRGAR